MLIRPAAPADRPTLCGLAGAAGVAYRPGEGMVLAAHDHGPVGWMEGIPDAVGPGAPVPPPHGPVQWVDWPVMGRWTKGSPDERGGEPYTSAHAVLTTLADCGRRCHPERMTPQASPTDPSRRRGRILPPCPWSPQEIRARTYRAVPDDDRAWEVVVSATVVGTVRRRAGGTRWEATTPAGERVATASGRHDAALGLILRQWDTGDT
jgi:hypothetical protein